MTWSAQQYLAFEEERTRPVRDLLNAVPNQDVRRAIDLGCGPGNSTEVLAARFPDALISGLDSSPDMIEASRKRLPHIRFDLAPIETWLESGQFDVVMANAVLQWIPNHGSLLPHLLTSVAPGGTLAVQIPDNLDEPAHCLMREIAAEQPWSDALAGAANLRSARHDADWYYSLLRPRCTKLDVWRTTYYHALAGGADAVVEWFKGSGLRPFLAPLADAEQQMFLDRYRSALERAYPALPGGTVLLPLPRLFIVATR
jgi:trans-aconitate 2-methyltransferase